MPAWHQLVSMSGHVEESETARKLQLYATSIYQVHSFVCQLDYESPFCKKARLHASTSGPALHALGFTEVSIFVIIIICIGVSRTTLFR